MAIIKEGQATIQTDDKEKISRDLSVFYNPIMKRNRDLTLLLIESLKRKDLRIGDVLAGSGVRSIRLLKELPKKMIKEIVINDIKEDFEKIIENNLKLSGFSKIPDKLIIKNSEANKLMLESHSFDYLDIDPFGSPNPFLDFGVRRSKRKGILAVTATDTAPLCGTYPKACIRKYWAKPLRNYLMHEIGLRILIRKCQLIGAQYDKALTPILCYSLDHYFRVFFEVAQGKSKVDVVLNQHGMLEEAGPMWLGELHDKSTIKKMLTIAKKKYPEHVKLLEILIEEASIKKTGFFDVHKLSKELKLSSPPPHKSIIQALKKKKIKSGRTHFSGTSIKADCSKEEIVDILKRLNHYSVL